jgi:SNF2 family DNA or RNA helicase
MNAVKLQLDGKTAYFEGTTFPYKALIGAIPGSGWQKKLRRWEIPLESVGDAVRIFPSLEIDPEVKTAFGSMQQRLQKAVSIKNKDFTKVKAGNIPGLNGTLRPYQQVSFDFLCTLEDGEGDVLALDMGLGKSIVALAYFLYMKSLGVVDYLLVVCPSPLKYATWAKELEKFTDLEYAVIDGDKRETVEWSDGTVEKLTGKRLREVQYQQWEFGTPVTIMNYELFLHDYDKGKHGTSHWEPGIIPKIDGRWMVVLDEAHRIKNPKATTTKNLIKHLEPARRKVLGTGTPLENNIQELWSLTDFCRKGILGNYWKFLERYVEMDYFGTPVAPKPQMMAELKGRISPIMIRITKAEALPDLPPLERVDYTVEMTKEQKKLYDQVKAGILQNVATGEFSYLEVVVQITRLQQVLDSPSLLRKFLDDPSLPVESGKLNQLQDILKDMSWKDNKFILFSQYKEMTNILYPWLTEVAGIPKDDIGYIRGGTKATEFERVRKGFQEKKWGEAGNVQCVLMTTAGNYGLDLYAGKYVICYDQLFNPQKMEQILSRAHRSGNLTGVTAITMTTKNSYEEKKQALLDKKRELFSAFVDESDEAFAKLFSKQELIDMI